MDSDGYISDRKGQAVYTSTEKALAESVSELLWSLGIKNAVTTHASTQRTDWSRPSVECGRVATGETCYTVKFTAFDDIRVAGLDRKQSSAVSRNPESRSHFRDIDKIEPIPNRGMQCIQVDSPSHQYLVGRSYLPTHNSELAAAIALYCLCADNEPKAEVYSAGVELNQARIVFNVAVDMMAQWHVLSRRCKLYKSAKEIHYLPLGGVYKALSADVAGKHGFSPSCVVVDEVHAHKDRTLIDNLLRGSGRARRQPLFFCISTAWDSRETMRTPLTSGNTSFSGKSAAEAQTSVFAFFHKSIAFLGEI